MMLCEVARNPSIVEQRFEIAAGPLDSGNGQGTVLPAKS
jgi:hypothetical protein